MWPHLQFVWSAWWEVHTDRPIGMGVGQIPFRALDAYATRFGIDDLDAFETFRALIRVMDGAFLEWSAKRSKSQPSSGR